MLILTGGWIVIWAMPIWIRIFLGFPLIVVCPGRRWWWWWLMAASWPSPTWAWSRLNILPSYVFCSYKIKLLPNRLVVFRWKMFQRTKYPWSCPSKGNLLTQRWKNCSHWLVTKLLFLPSCSYDDTGSRHQLGGDHTLLHESIGQGGIEQCNWWIWNHSLPDRGWGREQHRQGGGRARMDKHWRWAL